MDILYLTELISDDDQEDDAKRTEFLERCIGIITSVIDRSRIQNVLDSTVTISVDQLSRDELVDLYNKFRHEFGKVFRYLKRPGDRPDVLHASADTER